jgi:uncharacterized protein YndB with AHSA1/START domain
MTRNNFDFPTWLSTTKRDVRREAERVSAVVVRRPFDASIERVWKAWTEAWRDKIVSGVAKLGQTVVLDLDQPKRTTCRILVCEPPGRLAVTWTYGEPTELPPDEVEVRLSQDLDERVTILELEHRSKSAAAWAPGVGAGWEVGLLMFDFMFRDEDLSPAFGTHAELDAHWSRLVNASTP